ncbi:hypothetical protein MBLNU13_g08154t1 [Cladosporium sp. NU13]
MATKVTISQANGQPTKALNPTRDKPCISPVSSSPFGTYIDRPAISAEIAAKMQKSCGSRTLAHALALIGPGGIGKTQLELRYIEQHQKRYDTVLLLDVRDDAAMISSFERGCNALSIAFQEQTIKGSPHDAPTVQKLLEWLAGREQDQKCAYCHLMLQDPKAAATIVQESCQLSHASLRANDPTVEFRDTCLKALAL